MSSLSDSLFVLHVQREDNKQKVPLWPWEVGEVLWLWAGPELCSLLRVPPGGCGAAE